MNERSTCQRAGCPYQGHVVLYAAGGEFDGQHYRRGQALVYCLKDGGQIYDAIRLICAYARTEGIHRIDPALQVAPWLRFQLDSLPTVWADHHNRPHTQTPPWQRGQRATLPDRPKSRPRRAA